MWYAVEVKRGSLAPLWCILEVVVQARVHFGAESMTHSVCVCVGEGWLLGLGILIDKTAAIAWG